MSPNRNTEKASKPARRNTWQKQAIVENVMARHDHPTAQKIHNDLSALGIGIATVYRNLATMAEDGLISTVEHDGEVRYDRNVAPHAHAVCNVCDGIWDVPLPSNLPSALTPKGLATVDEIDLTFRGRCPTCV